MAAYYQKNKARFAARYAANRRKNRGANAVYAANYRRENPEFCAAYHLEGAERRRAITEALRLQFYDMYGLKKEGHEHGVCTCCKERDLVMFGTISHIDGSGGQHRKLANRNRAKMLKDALSIYNPSRFAAECACCNMAAEKYGRDVVIAYFARNRSIRSHKTGSLKSPDYHVVVRGETRQKKGGQ